MLLNTYNHIMRFCTNGISFIPCRSKVEGIYVMVMACVCVCVYVTPWLVNTISQEVKVV